MTFKYIAQKSKHMLLTLRNNWNPLKILVVVFVYYKANILYYLFGIGKLSSYLLQLDEDCTKMVLRAFGATIGKDCYIGSHIFVENAYPNFRNLRIGKGCHIGKDTFFDLRAPIIIEDFVTISMRATIITHISVGKSVLSNWYPKESASVQIKNDVYIGVNSTILKGVTIGQNSVVSAGSLVMRDVPKYTVVGGVPAKVLKNLKEVENNNSI
jgi:acetyltransferase-like isoleucine patch superfamily enzyme